jgi:hypothetical protein
MFSYMTAISPQIQGVLDLFSSTLGDVKFGDVDACSLARAADDVQSAADVVASAQAALDAARSTLHEREETLLLHAQRALAYARVYAETDEALSAQLEAITLPRPPRRPRTDGHEALVLSPDPQPATRPRGRPRKGVVSESMLGSLPDAMSSSPAE